MQKSLLGFSGSQEFSLLFLDAYRRKSLSRTAVALFFIILCTTEREREIGALRGKLSLRLFGGDYSFDGVVSAIAGDGFKLSITAYENAAAVSRQKTMALFGFWV